MGRYVLDLQELDRTHIALAGGKGAQLGELCRLDGIRVPPGFCVTTAAFRRVMAAAPSLDERLSRLAAGDGAAGRVLSAEIRRAIEAIALPEDVAAEIGDAVARLGPDAACAVRSSATAEDSPTTSFAGQHDSYLDIVGPAAILEHVRRCWASLFTERAVSYRLRNRIDHRSALMAVVVQRMVAPDAAGVLFTADPVTGHRRVATVEAGRGLGEGFVSGRVNADIYQVRDGVVVRNAPRHAEQPLLTVEQVLRLARLGRRIEAHFGHPQDIEWCLAGDDFLIVQARPITTLFPIPAAVDDGNRVYLSVGHQQMMTDAMKPLGISFWQLTAARPMDQAGGRLFVDVTTTLASPASRAALLRLAGQSDPLITDALQTLIDRGDFIPPEADAGAALPLPGSGPAPLDPDPALVAELIAHSQASIAALEREIRTKSGSALCDFILADIPELKRILFDPRSHRVFMTAMEASWWLNERLNEWLGEKNAADTLTLSVPDNITSEMGLALLDVADVIRPHPEVVAYLQHVSAEDFLDALPALPGGSEARAAIVQWLDRYGMRCAGEIDITRPRWRERPSTLVPLLLGNIRNFAPGESRRRFERGLQQASAREQALLQRVRALPDGERRAAETRLMIERVRTFIGYREYPKYGMVSRYWVYKQALMREADRLVQAGVLRDREDIFFLTFQEFQDVVRTRHADDGLVRARKDAFRFYETLVPPRVLTSDGEMINGAYRRDDLPAGALAGLGVSAGTIEGRARVVLDLAGAELEPGDILVTAFTDPSWTPLFLGIAGLVTEVGGLMTHGAVIAREYGLPAVTGVEHATRRIRDGQRIRVHGAEGYVELLEE